jgi:hypothetical protein
MMTRSSTTTSITTPISAGRVADLEPVITKLENPFRQQ